MKDWSVLNIIINLHLLTLVAAERATNDTKITATNLYILFGIVS